MFTFFKSTHCMQLAPTVKFPLILQERTSELDVFIVVARSSVVCRPPINPISRRPLHGSRPNFMGSYLSTIPISTKFYSFFQILNFHFISFHFFSFSLTCDANGAKLAKLYSCHKSLLNFIRLLLNFVCNILPKLLFWIFDFFFKFYETMKINMGVNGKS